LTKERQGIIVKHIEAKGFATIDKLAKEFAVSAQTIRRNIIEYLPKHYCSLFRPMTIYRCNIQYNLIHASRAWST